MPNLTDPDTKRAGLVALAASGRSPTLAHESLKRQGIDIPLSTLTDWTHRYSDEVQRIHDQIAPQLEAQMVRQHRDIALLAHEETMAMIHHAREQREEGKIKDAAGAARNLATTAAIVTDKLLALTGRPTQITEHREPSKLIDSLASKGISVQVHARDTNPALTEANPTDA